VPIAPNGTYQREFLRALVGGNGRVFRRVWKIIVISSKEDIMAQAPKDTFTPQMDEAAAKSILVITADNVEDLEFFYPYYRFVEEGYNVDVATPKGGEFKGKMGYGLPGTWKISDVNPSDYDLLYIPGGKAPAELKKDKETLELVRNFAQRGMPIAALCHGPQVLAAAGLIREKSIAGWPEIQDEIEKAGGIYRDEKTVVDGQFITARWPADLPSFMRSVVEHLQEPAGKGDNIHTSHLTV
jgi:protease I